MTKKAHCLSSMADGEGILHNGTSSNETPRSLAVLTHTKAESSNPKPPTSSGEGSAPCFCGTVITTSPGYVDEDGEEHDMEVYYRHCEVHDPDKKDFFWSITSLGDLMKLTNATLTKEGRAYWKELRRKSDEENPYIAEMERVRAEIRKIENELNFMGVAKEKIKDWNQQDQFDRAAGRERAPFPEWLERYRDIEKFYETRNQLEQKRQALMDQKFELHIEIVNYRYGLNSTKGGHNP